MFLQSIPLETTRNRLAVDLLPDMMDLIIMNKTKCHGALTMYTNCIDLINL